jgi:O-antigen ligase
VNGADRGIREGLLYRLNRLALLALLILPQLCFWQESSDPFAPVELLLIKVLAPLALIPWLLGARLDWTALLQAWSARLLLAWVAWLWVSAARSPWRSDGFKTALEYSLYAAVFFLPAACDAARRRLLLAAFGGASVLAAAYGFLQHFGLDPWRWSTDFGGRPLGTIGNPNFFGGHLVLVWGLVLGWLLTAPPQRRRLPAALFVLLSVTQYFSRSVGPWLGMAGSAFLALAIMLSPAGARWRAQWELRRFARSFGWMVLIGVLLFTAVQGRQFFSRLAAEKSVSVTNRLMMWKVALRDWREAPLLGSGLASIRPLYPKLQSQILREEAHAGWNYVVTWLPHQNFLYLLCETGLVGLGLFCGFWLLASVDGWRRLARGEAEALAALLGSAGLLGVSLLNTFSNIPPTALGFFFLLGLLAWPPAPASIPTASPASFRPSAEALAAALLLALAMGVPAGVELAANRLTREAGRLSRAGREQHAAAVLFLRKAAGFGIANFTQQSLVGVHFQLAEALRQTGRLEEAVAAYRADLAVNPWAPELHNMLGAALGELGARSGNIALLEESVRHLRTAYELNPGYGAPLLNLGGSLMLMGDKAGAAAAWKELLKLEPDNVQARSYLKLVEP